MTTIYRKSLLCISVLDFKVDFYIKFITGFNQEGMILNNRNNNFIIMNDSSDIKKSIINILIQITIKRKLKTITSMIELLFLIVNEIHQPTF